MKHLLIIISVLIFGTSCATQLTRNLNVATRACGDTSFAFDIAVRNYAITINDFRSAVFNLQSATQNLYNLINDENEPDRLAVSRARVRAFDARINSLEAKSATLDAHRLARQAFDESMRSETDFRQAEHALAVSGSNPSARLRANSARNISVRVHNDAVSRFDALVVSWGVIVENYDEVVEFFDRVIEQSE